MASKIQGRGFYVDVTPYKTDCPAAEEFNKLSVRVAYDDSSYRVGGNHFYVSIQPGWRSDFGFGCVMMGGKSPLDATQFVYVKEASRNSQKTIDQMYANLNTDEHKANIRMLFDGRKWDELKAYIREVVLTGSYLFSDNSQTTGETPMMKQYREIKANHPESLLLFRCGDFYEAYEEDAEKCAKVLGITLTNNKAGNKMAGFPHHALDSYLPKLIRAKYKVAICDQLEDPKLTKQVKRGITETINPQTTQSTNTQNTMETTNIQNAQDYVGKTIIVGENIATIVIKSANGDTLQGEYKSGNAQAAIIPISVERLFENLKAGTWKVDEPHEEPQDVVVPTTTEDEFAEFEEIKDDPNGDGDPDAIGEIVNAEGQESQSDDPVMQQWKEAKAKNPDAVTIFRSNGVYVVISDDATKVSEVTGLPTQNHGDVPICLFPVDKLQQIMSQLVRSGVRVRIDDLVQAPTEEPCAEAQDVEPIEEEATEEAAPTPTVKPRVLPRTAPKEEVTEEADEADGAEETDEAGEVEEVADVPTEEQADEPEPTAETSKPAPRHGEVTAKPEAGQPHIINYGKSIVVAGDTSRIEAVLMTLWGRKRPYTRSGATYSGIQMSAKHRKTVQEIIKLVAC